MLKLTNFKFQISILNSQFSILNSQTGYTLLEIIIVITLLGLMAGLAIPRLTSIYNSLEWKSEQDDVIRRIAQLGFSAFQEGRDIELKHYPVSDSEQLPLDLPAGWKIEAEPPIRYKANGICLGGKLRLIYKETSIMIYLRPPHCRPEISESYPSNSAKM